MHKILDRDGKVVFEDDDRATVLAALINLLSNDPLNLCGYHMPKET